jgi:streptogramin lyase
MKEIGNRASSLILSITILISFFISCHNKSKLNDTNQSVRAATESTGSSIDTSSWLRPTKGIRGIFEDSKGNLWFSSTDYVAVFNARQSNEHGSGFTYFTETDGLRGRGMVHEDPNGTIWIEAGFEAYSYDGTQFTSHPLKPDATGNEWGASPNDIWFKKGMKRFGNTEGPPGVYRLHDGEIQFLAFPVPETNNDDSAYHPTTGAIRGKDGTVWFGTMEVVVGYKNGFFTLIDREVLGRQDDPRPVGIRGLCADSKGNLWMADNGAGVFVYDGDSVINFTRLHHLDKGDTDGNTLHRAFSIAEDNAGNMWFETVYSGVWRYDPHSGVLTNFVEKDGLRSAGIWAIYKTRQGELLFAGEDPGAVYKFNGIAFERVY